MPNLWYFNLEEVAPNNAAMQKKSVRLSPRHLFYAKAGDIVVLPKLPDSAFVDHVCELKKIPKGSVQIITPSEAETLTLSREYHFRPYLQTRKAYVFAKKIGATLCETPEPLVDAGLIEKLNDKAFFKKLSVALGIATPPGLVGHDLNTITKQILEVSSQDHGHIFLRKTKLGGGLGNLCGNISHVLPQLEKWYHGETVLVEMELDLVKTLGSFVYLHDQRLEFLGIDTQIIQNGGWVGFSYPYVEEPFASKIDELSMAYAAYFHKMGARGMANIDWGLSKNGELIALECNFRLNAVSHWLELAQDMFGPPLSKIRMAGDDQRLTYLLSDFLSD